MIDPLGMVTQSQNPRRQLFSILLLGAMATVMCGATCRHRGPANGTDAALGAKAFVGVWVAATVDVSIRSKNTTGGNDHLHYDSKELAAAQGRKPSQTLFQGDGTYREETFNLRDSLVQFKKGFWNTYEDSLFMHLDAEGSPKIAFKAKQEGSGLQLISQLDWDGDGLRDDEMIVTLRRP